MLHSFALSLIVKSAPLLGSCACDNPRIEVLGSGESLLTLIEFGIQSVCETNYCLFLSINMWVQDIILPEVKHSTRKT